MLISLRIRNIALIEELEVPFQRGFQVLSGETGAGKSIVVDAVNLALGGRADRDLIRYGADRAWVEAAFDASDSPAALALLRENEIPCEDQLITLYREISRSGRNICRVCGVTMQVAFLKEVAALLMDVHGQHEQQFLMDPHSHLRFLDASGDGKHQALLARVQEAYGRFIENHRRYARLVKENNEKTYRMESLKRSLTELEKAALAPGEEEELKAERERSRHAGRIADALGQAHQALSAGDGQESALTRLKLALEAVQGLQELGEPYAELGKRFAGAYYELEEVSYEVATLAEREEYDPLRAEKVEERLDLIRRLERRYGADIPAILAEQERMQAEYDRFTSMDREVAELGAGHKRLLAAYREAARALTASRHSLAEQFERRMMQQLAELGMEKTVFTVCFHLPEEKRPQMPQPTGDDSVEFMIAPNPGEPAKPLSRIASGGELSRIMLAVKSLEAAHDGVGSMVFDEVDTGISGRMAQVVAEKMAGIARSRQVICVSHLPQIAAMADAQYLVAKRTEAGRTRTTVTPLSGEERVDELARMLGGADGTGESARAHARHMIEQGKSLQV